MTNHLLKPQHWVREGGCAPVYCQFQKQYSTAVLIYVITLGDLHSSCILLSFAVKISVHSSEPALLSSSAPFQCTAKGKVKGYVWILRGFTKPV